MLRNLLYYPVIIFILISGCATTSIDFSQSNKNTDAHANHLMKSGQHKRAAGLYQSLAKSKPPHSNHYQLLAIEAFIKSGDADSASNLIRTIDPRQLTTRQKSQYNLQFAQINLNNGRADEALSHLNKINLNTLEQQVLILYYQSLAFSYALLNKPFLSAKSRIQLSFLEQEASRKFENNKVILDTLKSLPSRELTIHQQQSPYVLKGWISLAQIFKSSPIPRIDGLLQEQLQNWSRDFPQHPANNSFIDQYIASNYAQEKALLSDTPSVVAILLPESGRVANASRAIKEGINAAYNTLPFGEGPELRFYDTSLGYIENIYQQAVSDGAELIIGPLRKKRIEELILNSDLPVPVLALNHINGIFNPNVYQFGLNPLDEASQVVTRVAMDDKKNLLVLSPDTQKGNRIFEFLSHYWPSLNGNILEQQTYDHKTHDFSAPIKSLLNQDESKNRHQRVQQLLATKIQFKERMRQDIDAIFIDANAEIARSIYPQLRFYGTKKIPVYAQPGIFTGVLDTKLDKDLNSVTFCDIPWFFPEAYQEEPSLSSLQDIWQHYPLKHLRLFALGIDAFNLIFHLSHLEQTVFSGATGQISLNQENMLTRELVCAKFRKGSTFLLDPLYVESMQPQEESFQ